jgi:hypothetical protein
MPGVPEVSSTTARAQRTLTMTSNDNNVIRGRRGALPIPRTEGEVCRIGIVPLDPLTHFPVCGESIGDDEDCLWFQDVGAFIHYRCLREAASLTFQASERARREEQQRVSKGFPVVSGVEEEICGICRQSLVDEPDALWHSQSDTFVHQLCFARLIAEARGTVAVEVRLLED